MTDHQPFWWEGIQTELREILEGFGTKVQDKLIDFQLDPMANLRRKNPFLYRIRGCETPERLALEIVNAYISSSEETMFGEIFERMAIVVAREAHEGRKSSSEAIDLEWDEVGPPNTRILVQVKSGPNWGNSQQQRRMLDTFRRATQAYRSNNPDSQVLCVEGCCYGRNETRDRGTHLKIVGMDFWSFISKWDACSLALLELVGEFSRNGFTRYKESAVTQTVAYLEESAVVTANHMIDWSSLHTLLSNPD